MTVFALNQILQNMSHLTKEQRFTIFVMQQQGFRNNQIANVIGKDKSVISRALKRNCDKRSGQYRANENMNGLIRQYLPKGSSFEDLTDKDISFIQNRLNNSLTPLEYFLALL